MFADLRRGGETLLNRELEAWTPRDGATERASSIAMSAIGRYKRIGGELGEARPRSPLSGFSTALPTSFSQSSLRRSERTGQRTPDRVRRSRDLPAPLGLRPVRLAD